MFQYSAPKKYYYYVWLVTHTCMSIFHIKWDNNINNELDKLNTPVIPWNVLNSWLYVMITLVSLFGQIFRIIQSAYYATIICFKNPDVGYTAELVCMDFIHINPSIFDIRIEYSCVLVYWLIRKSLHSLFIRQVVKSLPNISPSLWTSWRKFPWKVWTDLHEKNILNAKIRVATANYVAIR